MSSKREARRSPLATRIKRILVAGVLLPGLLASSIALADVDDDYEQVEAGHPLRIVAYVLHPVGVILETLIFRPAAWIGSKEPMKTLFGQQD